jgi:hypothetical protein
MQALIRIVFSKEKYKFIKLDRQFHYEVDFIKLVVDKCIEIYFESFGNNHKTLFRSDNFFDDIIKYTSFVFSNNLFFQDYGNYLNKN